MSVVDDQQPEVQQVREIGPERFIRQQAELAAAEQPDGRGLRALGAAAALLLVIVGIPVALALLGGMPRLPTSLPDREVLSHALSLEQLVNVLLVVVWLAWLQFTLCTLVELVSAVRGVGLPTRVPLSGPSQRLARGLVGALLITAAVAGPASAAGFTPGSDGGARVDVATTRSAGSAHGTAGVSAQVAERGVAGDQATATAQADNPLAGHKVYTVKAPEGRYHDNLWDIAERHLGDGRRYKEIFALNAGLEQPDGRTLELDRLIQPGWQLIMPGDATGVTSVPVAPAPQARPAAPTRATGADVAAPVPHSAAADHAVPGGGRSTLAQDSDHTLSGGLVGGGLLAAGLLAALWRGRRRPGAGPVDEEALDTEVALRVGADLERARSIDTALRGLARRCAAEHLDLPPVFAARASSERLELLLAPASTSAPLGWQVVQDGSCWVTDLDPAGDGETASSPYPSLVSVGRDGEGRDVLLDLDAADGPIVLAGDPAAAAEVGLAMAVSLATSPWAAGLAIGISGLPRHVHAIAPDRLHPVHDPAAALSALVAGVPALDGVISGDDARGPRHEVLVLGSDPGPGALAPLVSAVGRRVGGVIVAAEVPGASWRLHVDEAGTIAISPLELEVTGYRLDDRTVVALARLLSAARADEPVPTPATQPAIGAPAPAVAVDDAEWMAAPSRIAVLGAPEARASGALDPSRIALATEVLAFLAVHRDGVHPSVLGAAVWPRGVGADVRDATLARVRDWIGTDPAGHDLLRTLPDGRMQLAPDVPSDWDVVRTLAARADAERGTSTEADLLRRALRVVRGPLLAGAPQGRYAWVVRTRLERSVPETVVAVAHRLCTVIAPTDPAGAVIAATAGLRLDPGAQLLWRDLLCAAHAQDGPDGNGAQLAAAVHRMSSVLTDVGQPVEAETEALVEELSPGLLAREA